MPYIAYNAGSFAQGNASVDLSGVQALLSAGSLSVTGTASVIPTGVTASVLVGTIDSPVQWDSTHKHSGYSLSNGDLTVTVTDDGGGRIDHSSVRAVTSRSSGKKYIEIDADSSHASQYGSVGLATSTETTSHYIGETSASWGYFTSGSLIHNAGLLQSFGSWVSFQPAQFGIAVDFDAGKAWFAMQATGSQFWQGSGDPASGTNPSFTFTPGTALYPAWTGGENTDYAIITSTSGAFRFAPPTGFTAWATA